MQKSAKITTFLSANIKIINVSCLLDPKFSVDLALLTLTDPNWPKITIYIYQNEIWISNVYVLFAPLPSPVKSG